ncbi:MAG TPA: Holliday junction branch migration protein RuvA [Methanospirillum sp.]|uniref:Holliday junction branch migration protein RuvA n=1 Tax=Methanospirillum sp. TaxID=45200 RepID=UPI002C3B56BA|nr:Holliday junction branch migration protein RuvA [Methanospirillum sp.]HWQ65052.1 Holliday junction branch migration protein RuvA [Methanospirillum sp.]
MIARLRGPVVDAGDDYIIIEAAGVGYRIRVPETSAVALRGSKEAVIHTEMVVRQDAILLYGFQTADELKVFRMLISVSRVGPQLATAILSRLRPDQIAGAVLAGDSRLLATVPGVGKTGAERIVLELKKKAAILAADLGTPGQEGGNNAQADAVLGLMALGYGQGESAAAVGKMDASAHDGTPAGIIREALRLLKDKGEKNE